MKFLFITLFPEIIEQATGFSILKRALEQGLIEVSCINPRDFAADRHKTVDDVPFGGGAGMVLKVEPFAQAINEAKKQLPGADVIALCPSGKTLIQRKVQELASSQRDLIFLCGHYEGFDERIFAWVDERVSIGDYILTGGELPALVVMDAVSRYIPGVLGKQESTQEESFGESLLEYPQYTRPVVYEDMEVPSVLRGGNHAEIRRWRRREALKATYLYRPDLLAQSDLALDDGMLLLSVVKEKSGEKNG